MARLTLRSILRRSQDRTIKIRPVRTFCTFVKAARNGPHAPPIGRLLAARSAAHGDQADAHRLARIARSPSGAAEIDGQRRRKLIRPGRQPAGDELGYAAWQPRRAVARVPGRARCLRQGAPAPGWPRSHAPPGKWVVARRHPARRRPGRSRADHRPGRQRPYRRQGSLDVAARAAARSHDGRVDGERDDGYVTRRLPLP